MSRLHEVAPESRTMSVGPTSRRPEPGPQWVLSLQRAAGNQATATLMRVGGWGKDALPGSGNDGKPPAIAGKSGYSVRRIPVTGLTGAATDKAIVYLPALLPAGGGPIDVLLHLHGHPAGGPAGYLGGKSDTDVTDKGDSKTYRPSAQADDIDEYRIGAQLAAAGRPMVAILPQGIGKSDFGAGRARDFDADHYIVSAFGRLGSIGAWTPKNAPTPGRVALSGHSGADNPISTMLSSSLAPDNLGALFLFDTMYPKAGYAEKIWTYVRGRLDQELSELQAIAAQARERAGRTGPAPGATALTSIAIALAQADFLTRQGFRLFNVHGGGTYKPQSDYLQRQLTSWFRQRRVRTVVGDPGSPVATCWRANFQIFQSSDRTPGVHMRILRYGDHLKRAVDLLPQRTAVGTAPAPVRDAVNGPTVARVPDAATTTNPDQVIAEARARILATVLAAAAPFVGTAHAADLPGMLTMQIITGTADPRKRLKPDNPMRPLYDALWDTAVVDDLRTIDDPTAKKDAKRPPKKAEDRRRAILADLLAGLMPSSAVGAAVAAPAAPLDQAAQIATEKSLLEGNLKSLTRKSWESVRLAVLTKFGALADGPRTAISRANTYYDGLVRARLLKGTMDTLVHPDLQAALERTEKHLRPQLAALPTAEVAAIDAAVATMYSTNIRPNQNAKHKLSDHSFGWAIDIDASRNPNIGKGSGLAAVAAVTGTNPRATVTAGRSADQVLAAATDLRQVSRDYVAAMANDATIAPVLLRLANEGRVAAKLPALESTAGPALVAAIRTSKKGDRKSAVRAAAWPEGVDRPPVSPGKGKRPVPPTPPEALAAAIATIQTVGDAYRSSFTSKGARVGARSAGTAGSVAAHGFFNLPPALVAALCGSDAGGLTWLGTVNQDYMHVELRQEPPLF